MTGLRNDRGWWGAWVRALRTSTRNRLVWAANSALWNKQDKQREQAQNACPPRGIVFGMRCARALRARTCYYSRSSSTRILIRTGSACALRNKPTKASKVMTEEADASTRLIIVSFMLTVSYRMPTSARKKKNNYAF